MLFEKTDKFSEGGATISRKRVVSYEELFATQAQFKWIKDYVKNLASAIHVEGTCCTLKQIDKRELLHTTSWLLDIFLILLKLQKSASGRIGVV